MEGGKFEIISSRFREILNMFVCQSLYGSLGGPLEGITEKEFWTMSCWVKEENHRAWDDSLKRQMMANFWSQVKIKQATDEKVSL